MTPVTALLIGLGIGAIGVLLAVGIGMAQMRWLEDGCREKHW